jgi:hypothetical protein
LESTSFRRRITFANDFGGYLFDYCSFLGNFRALRRDGCPWNSMGRTRRKALPQGAFK